MKTYKSDYLQTCEAKSIIRYYTEVGEARGIQIGEARGIQIGEARGIRLGKEQGIQLGEARGEVRGTRNTSLMIALDMAKEGEPIAKISKFTKLPVEELTNYFKQENVSITNLK